MTNPRLTFDQLAALDPCDLPSRAKLFPDPSKPIDARQAIAKGVSIKDLLWVAGKLNLQPQVVEFAIAVAQRVAHLDPSGSAQRCLDATIAHQKDPSPENMGILKACRNAAADAAYYAADAATYAATSAVRAADVATSRAAAYAAYATSDASAAAHYDAAEREAQKVILLDIFAPRGATTL